MFLPTNLDLHHGLLRMFVSAIVVQDDMYGQSRIDRGLYAVEKHRNFRWRCRGWQGPMTVPSNTLRVANRTQLCRAAMLRGDTSSDGPLK